jgi:PAS domain S-box-containing protein
MLGDHSSPPRAAWRRSPRVTPAGHEVVSARGYPTQDVAALADPTRRRSARRPVRIGVWLGSAPEVSERFPEVAAANQRLGFRGALAALPLEASGRILGGAAVQLAGPLAWTDEDKEFLRSIVRQAAQALTRSELREAEAVAVAGLERSERRYRSLVQAAAAIEWTTDPVGTFVEPQRSWEDYTGQPWDRHRGFGWLDAIHEEDRETVMRHWLAARDGAPFFEARGRLWHEPSGAFRHFVARAAPVRDAAGRVLEWVGTIMDVHEQRAAELAAAERERAARVELEAAGERLAYLADAARSSRARPTRMRRCDASPTSPCHGPPTGARSTCWSRWILPAVAVSHVDPRRWTRGGWRALSLDPDAPTGVPGSSGPGTRSSSTDPRAARGREGPNPELEELVAICSSDRWSPIAVGDRRTGAMQFVGRRAAALTTDDLALAQDLATTRPSP